MIRNNKKRKELVYLGYACCEGLKYIQKKLPESFGILKTPEIADVGVMAIGYYFFKDKKECLKWFELGAGISLAKDFFGIRVFPFAEVAIIQSFTGAKPSQRGKGFSREKDRLF